MNSDYKEIRVILSIGSIIQNRDHLKISLVEAAHLIFAKTEEEISQIS